MTQKLGKKVAFWNNDNDIKQRAHVQHYGQILRILLLVLFCFVFDVKEPSQI